LRCAEAFALLMTELAGVTVAPPLPNPPWMPGPTNHHANAGTGARRAESSTTIELA
jgi:hypothetical protein